MYIAQELERFPIACARRRHEFEQRFRVIGRNVRMRQRRAERSRMWLAGQSPVSIDAQAFLFDAAQAMPDKIGMPVFPEPGKPRLQRLEPISESPRRLAQSRALNW